MYTFKILFDFTVVKRYIKSNKKSPGINPRLHKKKKRT